MTDMLVKLYDLPSQGIHIEQPMPLDRRHVLRFVVEHFGATSDPFGASSLEVQSGGTLAGLPDLASAPARARSRRPPIDSISSV